MPDLPSGTVTFLMSDVEGSTALWRERPGDMGAAMAAHDAIIVECVSSHGGVPLKSHGEGDSTFSVFASAIDAAHAALDVMRTLADPDSPAHLLRVRLALHTGDAQPRDGDYFAPAANLCARIRESAHGGQALASSVTLGLCHDRLPPGTQVLDLGAYRLRGISEAQQLHQLAPAGAGVAFPPLRAPLAAGDRLPLELTSFVGREAEVEQVLGELRHSRMLTLLGVAGVGKTRLALRAARLAGNDYSDGVHWVDLSALEDADLVPQAVASTLGLQADPTQDVPDLLVSWLRGRECLLVLDNCERLLDACAGLAQRILVTCPSVRMLATSREAIGIYGERVWPVPPLSLPARAAPGQRRQSVPDALESDAVRLFVERSRLRDPRFESGPSTLPAIAEICRQLEGIPLSIELVAAKTGVFSLRELAERTRECFNALTASDLRTVSPRHRSLHAAVAWSYAGLDEGEACLFRRLSVFRGWFRLDAAAAVCRDESARSGQLLAVLGRLHDKSMVVADPTADEARFRMLEPVRQFGQEMLAQSGESDRVRLMHLEHLMELGEAAEPHLRSAGVATWLARLDEAADDVRAALRYATEAGETVLGLRLASAVWRYWYLRGDLREGQELLRSLTVADAEAAPPELRAKVLHGLGTLLTYLAEYRSARTALEESLAIRRELGDPTRIAFTLNNLGIVTAQLGDFEATRKFYEESIELKHAAGDLLGEAGSLGNLAAILVGIGDYEGAARAAERSLALGHAAGDEFISATAMQVTAHIARDRGDLEAAEQLYRRVLELSTRGGLDAQIGERMRLLGEIRLQRGDIAEGRELLDDSLERERERGSRTGTAQALAYRAELDLLDGNHAAAIDRLEEALSLHALEGKPFEIMNCHHGLARARLLAGDVAAAQYELEAGLRLAWSLGYRLHAVCMLETASQLAVASGSDRDGLVLDGAAAAERERLGTPLLPIDRAARDDALAAATDRLGPYEVATNLDAGRSLSLDQACALALGEAPS